MPATKAVVLWSIVYVFDLTCEYFVKGFDIVIMRSDLLPQNTVVLLQYLDYIAYKISWELF